MFNVCTITEIPWQRNAIHFQSHEEPCLLKEKKTEVTSRNKNAKNSSRQKIYKKEIFKTGRLTVSKKAKIK